MPRGELAEGRVRSSLHPFGNTAKGGTVKVQNQVSLAGHAVSSLLALHDCLPSESTPTHNNCPEEICNNGNEAVIGGVVWVC